VNQSKLQVITCSRREARENECERVTIGLGFPSDWIVLQSGASFLNQSRNVAMQNQLLFNTKVKTALSILISNSTLLLDQLYQLCTTGLGRQNKLAIAERFTGLSSPYTLLTDRHRSYRTFTPWKSLSRGGFSGGRGEGGRNHLFFVFSKCSQNSISSVSRKEIFIRFVGGFVWEGCLHSTSISSAPCIWIQLICPAFCSRIRTSVLRFATHSYA